MAMLERSKKSALEGQLKTEKQRLASKALELTKCSPSSAKHDGLLRDARAIMNSVTRLSEDIIRLKENL